MGYKILHLLILAFAVVYIQAHDIPDREASYESSNEDPSNAMTPLPNESTEIEKDSENVQRFIQFKYGICSTIKWILELFIKSCSTEKMNCIYKQLCKLKSVIFEMVSKIKDMCFDQIRKMTDAKKKIMYGMINKGVCFFESVCKNAAQCMKKDLAKVCGVTGGGIHNGKW